MNVRVSADSSVLDVSGLPVPAALTLIGDALRDGRSIRAVDPRRNPVHPPVGPGHLLLSTSGSSGRPKALTRTVRSWEESFPAFTALTGIGPEDQVWLTGPLHVTMHLYAAVHALSVGAAITEDPGSATAAHTTPAGLGSLTMRAPALRTAVVAGSATRPADTELAADRGLRLVEYYGAAELSLVAARVGIDPLRAVDGVELDVRDGVVWVRSPYFAHEAVRDQDGWATVGDLGRLDDGVLTVLGRGDAAIDVGGTTVIAEDVEATLGAIAGVREVAALGVAHPKLGATVAVVLVLEDSTTLDAVRAEARTMLDRPSTPTRWVLAEHLPRTTSGKLARSEIEDLLP